VNAFGLLSKNLGLLVKMKELARKQEGFLFEDQMDGFLELSSQRERLQSEISANQLKYQKALTEKTEKNRDPFVEEKVRSISSEMVDTLRSIQDMDRKIEELLTAKKKNLLLEIRNLRRGHKALRGYGGGAEKIPKFIDREG
jgi:hypothetical protein